jgi:D-alanyl-D-alanine carboxypeptidase
MFKLPTACVVLIAALPGATCTAVAATANATPDLGARIDKMLSATYKADAPGITIIVVKDGKTLLHKGYGLADLVQRRPLTSDTVLRIASLTKQFTSTAVLMLVDEGKIKLDDDITTYLPDYPTKGKKITIEHLLTHTSGIVSYTSKPDLDETREYTVQQMIDSFKNDPLEFEPGSNYKYNNSGYFLLGAIIEKVSGKTYDKFVEERIFVPLGMTRTAYEGHERSKAEHAQGYTRSPQGFDLCSPMSMSQPYAAGALVSTVDDLARWDAAVSSGKLLKAANWQRAFTPYVLSTGKDTAYGYGWGVGSFRGVKMVSHDGGINGFNSFVLRLPSEKVYVATLSNAESGVVAASEAAYKAAAIAIGKPFPDQEIKLAPALLDAYTGVYRIGGVGANDMNTVRRDGERLILQRSGSPSFVLQAFSEDGFFTTNDLTTYEFTRDESGKSTRLIVHFPTADRAGPRTGDALPARVAIKIDPAVFDAYIGRYQLGPNSVLTVSRKGGRFWFDDNGQPKTEMFPLNSKVLFSNDIDVELRFDDAKPGQLVVAQGGGQITATKLP